MVATDLAKEDPIEFRDIWYRGYDTTGANPFFLKREQALQNTIKMYLMSMRGDYGRNLAKGGPLFELIGKPATSEAEIEKIIRDALKIYTNIEVLEVHSTFDATAKKWTISLRFLDTLNKIETQTSLGLLQ